MKSPALTLVFLITVSLPLFSYDPAEVHSFHAPWGIPGGTPEGSDLIFRQLYTVSTNDETKLLNWIAFHLTPELVANTYDVGRGYATDPLLEPHETLEERSGRGDYTGAYARDRSGYDRGHMFPRGAATGSPLADQQINYLSNIAPQRSLLNQGLWRYMEQGYQDFIQRSGQALYALVGPYYLRGEYDRLPGADEEHRVPHGFWTIVYDEALDHVMAFAMEQDVPSGSDYMNYGVTVDQVEALSGFDFFSLAASNQEALVEGRLDGRWLQP